MKAYKRSEARLCRTVGGKATFEVAGSVAEGARMWIGSTRQPLTFDRGFFIRLRCDLSGLGAIRIGSKFDDPGPDSLGEWIRRDRKMSMNPAVYVGGLLVYEGYAAPAGRGRIRILMERRAPAAPIEKEPQGLRARLLARIAALPREDLASVEAAFKSL